MELSIPPVQWPDLVLAEALVGILLLLAKMSSRGLLPLRVVAPSHKPPLWHVLLLPTPPLKWPELVLAVALVETPHRSSAATVSLLNKPQELRSIAEALALSLSFPIALTASSAPHSRTPTDKQ